MPKNIFQGKKKLILFLSVLILFTVTLTGCNWFADGILNVFDPKAQIRVLSVEYVDESKTSLNLEVASLNQVEFLGTGIKLKYYNNGTRVSSLDTSASGSFYIAPASAPGTLGASTEISDITLYTGAVLNYVKNNKAYNKITCDLYLVGTDGAGHNQEIKVSEKLPALGIDTTNPTASIEMSVNSGECPLTVIFDGSGSTDDGFGIVSYAWQIPQVQSGIVSTNSNFSYTFPCSLLSEQNEITVSVALTVTDYHGNQHTKLDALTITKPVEEDNGDGCPLT